MLRSRPSLNVVERIDSAAGVMIAAPRPWKARAPISDASDQASPASSEATVNTTMPPRNMPAAAQHVGGPSAEQQEPAEDQGVGADHPLEVLLGEPEVALDGGQSDVHDRDVEDDHELDDAQEREGQPLAAVVDADSGCLLF